MPMNLPGLLDRQLELRRQPSDRHLALHASQLGHPCMRYLVYHRLRGEERRRTETGLLRIFDLGNEVESYVMRRLMMAGVQILEQQRQAYYERYNIKGSIDGKVSLRQIEEAAAGLGLGRTGESKREWFAEEICILEIKSCGEGFWRKLCELDGDAPDLGAFDDNWITKRWADQCLIYCLLEGITTCLLLLFRKATGELKQLRINLLDNLERAEGLLKKAETVEKVVADRNVCPTSDDGWPARLNQPRVCGGCEYEHICCPTLTYGPGLQEIFDEQLLADIREWEELKESGRRRDQLWKEISGRFELPEGIGEGLWLVGGEYQVMAKRDSRGAVRRKVERLSAEGAEGAEVV